MPKVNGSDGAKPAESTERIAPALEPLVVDESTLVYDPLNARLHPERNMEAIKASLRLYGQVKPLVVRAATRHVVAGNGTLAAARALGWRRIAATFVDMTEAEAAGYGLADNRTAELARWDFEVVGKVERLMAELGGAEMVGWDLEELTALRQSAEGFVPPVPADGGGQSWQELWQGMPEFDQQDLATQWGQVLVRFKTEQDMSNFYSLVGGKVRGAKLGDSMWFPVPAPGEYADKLYVQKEAT